MAQAIATGMGWDCIGMMVLLRLLIFSHFFSRDIFWPALALGWFRAGPGFGTAGARLGRRWDRARDLVRYKASGDPGAGVRGVG